MERILKKAFVVTALAIVISFEALAQADPAATKGPPPASPYKLKPDVSFLGMRFEAPDGNSIGPLPFDLPYEALSSAQQARVKSAYESMGEGDEPPFPVGGLAAIYDPITKGQHKVLVEGEFSAEVTIDPQGEPVSIAVFKTPGARFTNFVAGVAMLAKYKPAKCNGVPCAMGFPIRFKLKVE